MLSMNLLASFFLLLWAVINYQGAIFHDNFSRPFAAYVWSVQDGPDIDGEWIEWDSHAVIVAAYGKWAEVYSLWPREYGILRHKEKQGGVYFDLGARRR